MENRGITCGVRDNRRHYVLRWGSLIGLRSVAHLGERDAWGPGGSIEELVDRFWTGSTMLKCIRLLM